MLKYALMARTSTLGTGGMMGALGLMSVRYMALESSSSDGGTFSFRCRSSHCQWDISYYYIFPQFILFKRKQLLESRR